MSKVDTNITDSLFESLLLNSAVVPEEKKEYLNEYQDLHIPTKKDEDWKYTEIGKVYETEYVQASLFTISNEAIEKLLPKTKPAARICFINGLYSASHSKIAVQGLSIESLKDSCRREACGFNATFNATKISKRGKLELLNTIFASEGVIIRVARNVSIKEPIELVYLHQGTNAAVLQNRNIIVCEGGSKTNYIAYHLSVNESVHFNNIATEIVVKENATVSYNQTYNETDQNTSYHAIEVTQEANSCFDAHSYLINGGLVRSNIQVTHGGSGCVTNLNGLYTPTNEQTLDTFTSVSHMYPECTTNELYKGVAAHKSTGIFVGRIYVAKDAQKTMARQSNKNILISPEATIHSKPQLEIWADDVSCTHGSSIGQLNADQLFYCQARGINRDSAVLLLLHAFVAEVIEKNENEALKEYVYDLIARKENF
jgi:Fe-S cluster assembly protein SufD